MLAVWILLTALAGLDVLAHIHEVENINYLYPRFIFDSTPLLEKRQAGNGCDLGQHSCQAINATGCCPNDGYCYVNVAGESRCCQKGSRCDDPCPLSQYKCTISSTTGCCPRACPAPSGYQCPRSLGGNCCSVGSACLTSNSCLSIVNTATINTVSATPTGCTSGSFSCPANIGGGCCGNGQTCTALASRLYCAGSDGASTSARQTGGTALTTGTPSSSSSSGLSSGAKAGIGVGVSLGILLLIGLVAWIFRYRRRHRHQSNPPLSSLSSSHHQPPPATSQISPPVSTGADYFGPIAQQGPYSHSHSQVAGAAGMGAYTPSGYSGRGAVPVSPQGPNDIATPVEIAESEVPSPGESTVGSPGRKAGVGLMGDMKPPAIESEKGRSELA